MRWAAALLLAACAGPETLDEHACPPGTLTYESFGAAFFDRHCVRCHGAPGGQSSRAFTTVEAIRADAARIFVNAAAGNVTMPPGPDDPSPEERQKLADWLACGAP